MLPLLLTLFNRPEPESSDEEDETPVRAVKTRGGSSSAAALSGAMDSLSLSSSKAKATPPSPPKSKAKGKGKAASVTATVGAEDEHGTLVSEIGDLYLWDFKQEQFNVIEEEIAAKVVDMGGGKKFNCLSFPSSPLDPATNADGCFH